MYRAMVSKQCTYVDNRLTLARVFMVKVLFKAFELPKVAPFLYQRIIETVHSQMIYDKGVLSDSIFEASPNAEDEVKKALTFFKSRMKEYLLEMGHSGELTAEHQGLSKALDDFEAYLWKWGWDLRGSVNRAGKLRLEDGEEVDMDLDDGDDERGEFAPVICDENGQEVQTLRHLSPWQ